METETILSLVSSNKEELFAKSKEKKEKFYDNIVTFSRNLFIPITHQCRNRCGYCSFVSDSADSWVDPIKYDTLLKEAREANCKEILLTMGEKPEEKYQSAREFLSKYGFESTVEYVKSLCDYSINKHLLPHSNLGVLSFKELNLLKDSNASMGLMLESISNRLMQEGQPHQFSPGKKPSLRLETISNAGKLKIPFTTGILIGIGENWEERIESLKEINRIHQKFGHIQEVIVQNFNPQQNTPMANWTPPTDLDIFLSLSIARIILHPSVSIQIPPNLNPARVIDALDSGANDLGGISPISIDYINPNKGWHKESKLRKQLTEEGYELCERLPVYPQYEKYLNTKIREIIEEYHENEKTLYSVNR